MESEPDKGRRGFRSPGISDVRRVVPPTRSRARGRSGNPPVGSADGTERAAGKECGNPTWPRARPARRGCWTRPSLRVGRSVNNLAHGARRRQPSGVRCPAGQWARCDRGRGEVGAPCVARGLGFRGQSRRRGGVRGVRWPRRATLSQSPRQGVGASCEYPECQIAFRSQGQRTGAKVARNRHRGCWPKVAARGRDPPASKRRTLAA